MATNIEIEAKVLINESEYDKTIKHFLGNAVSVYNQTNYYIESKDLDLKKLGMSLRIREKEGIYTMTLKAPLSEGLLEKNCLISKEEYETFRDKNIFPENQISEFVRMLGFEPSDLSIVTSMKTHRFETKYGEEEYEFSIDRNEYNGIVDYELEMSNNSLQRAKTELEKICYELKIPYVDNPRSKQTRALESLK